MLLDKKKLLCNYIVLSDDDTSVKNSMLLWQMPFLVSVCLPCTWLKFLK